MDLASGSATKRKRKRIKLRCLVCKDVFDDDYRLKHNRKKHADLLGKNKAIGYETFGALASPFSSVQKNNKTKPVSFLNIPIYF